MKKTIWKRCLALAMTASMIIPSAPSVAAQGKVSIPEPYYEFTFDEGATNGKVPNQGTKTGAFAEIKGSKEGLGIIDDDARASKVLNLPGGNTNGAVEGRLSLPENMFADVTDQGFAFSFWINIDTTASQYSRIFSGTVDGQNSSNGNNGKWDAPEFSFVAGKEGAEDLADQKAGYHSAVILPDNSKTTLKLVWEQQFARGKWQHVTISVSPTDYDVYLDGQPVGIKYDRNSNMSAVLTSLFADNAAVLKQYKDCAIGSSVYTTDKDLKAKVDEFRFYNTALTAEQADAAYDSYAVDADVVRQLQDRVNEAKAKNSSFYTRDSYETLLQAITKGEEGIANPVTETNVNKLIANLDAAMENLAFYTGITAGTTFSNDQLAKETALAKRVAEQGGLSDESSKQLSDALKKAEAALALPQQASNQEAVDAALQQLRTAVDQISYGSTLHFDADPGKTKGALLHGSTGFLYGVSEVNVPSADLIQAISPKILVQKAKDGQQHPSGDGYRLTPFLKSCGVENIQIYLQDYYLQWPYEYNGIDDYNTKVDKIVREMVKGKTEEEIAGYSFVLFNEPDGIWYNNSSKVPQLCEDWLKIYTTVKSIDPKIKVAGPNFSVYNTNAYRTFFQYCQEHNCLPEYITWHELQKDKLRSFKSHCDEIKGFIKTYYANSGIDPILFVNEVANFSDVGNPGSLVNWLAIFEEENAYASLPYWGLANSLNELAADANKPNGAWWIYKWYAQMTGNKTPLTLEKIANPSARGSLYGLTSVDDNAGIVYSLFGGQAGSQTVSIENIRSTKTFENATNAHVKIYSTKFTGHHGFAENTPVAYEGNLAFSGNNLVFTIPNAELNDAYFAIITQATNGENTIIAEYGKNWQKTYEAEDAALLGNARKYEQTGDTTLARSNRADVGSLDAQGDGVKFTVEVPQAGRYRMNVYYSSQAPCVNPLTLEYTTSADGAQNRAIGAFVMHSLTIDGKKQADLVYDSTVKWGYYNYRTVYMDLAAGKHEIQIMYKGNSLNRTNSGMNEKCVLSATLDKIDLTYEPNQAAVVSVEPEELVGSKDGYTLSREGNYSGAGSAKGSGAFDFYVCVPRDGYYSIGTSGNGKAVLAKSKVNFARDAKAESDISLSWLDLFSMDLGNVDAGMAYLTAGMNHLRLTGNNLTIDKVVFTEVPEAAGKKTVTVEAEDCEVSGTKAEDGYNYLPGSKAVPEVIENKYASGGKAVEGFRGGKDNKLTLKVTVPQEGDYKLSVFYANNEPAPVMKKQNGDNYVHPYNTDLVGRYMQIGVNGGTPQTVYFRNTLAWDTYKNTVVDVSLKEGTNTITFTNDNSYKFSSVQDDFTPRLDKFAVAPAKAEKAAENPPVVEKKQNNITGVPSSIKKVYGSKAFTLKARGEGTISYASDNKKVVTVGATDGKVTIRGYGKAVITVNAAGNSEYQSAAKKIAVTISPKKMKIASAKSSKKKTMTVKWKKDSKADSYQIQYCLKKNFKKGARTVSVKKGKTKANIGKLKAGKKYYVRIRACKGSGKNRVSGAWSTAKKVTVKKR